MLTDCKSNVTFLKKYQSVKVGLSSIEVPSRVSSIGAEAFSGCSSLASVLIPSSVTSIGSFAFSGCSSLASVLIPSRVTSIGSFAFQNCSSLNSLAVEAENTMYDSRYDCNAIIETASNTLIAGCATTIIPRSVTAIGDKAFSERTGLTALTIPNRVKTIGENAFEGCSNLAAINIPGSTISIGYNAFAGCSSLVKSEFASIESLCGISFANPSANPMSVTHCLYVGNNEVSELTFPTDMDTIKKYTFYGCSNLKSVNIGDYVKVIDVGAFSGCSGLASLSIGDNVGVIGHEAFMGCSSLTPLFIGKSVREIGDKVFSGCSSLVSVIIPDRVTIIGDRVFDGCSELSSLAFGRSVTKIGDYIFGEERNIYPSDIYCYAENPPVAEKTFYYAPIGNITLHVPESALDAYENTAPWWDFGNIEKSITVGIASVFNNAPTILHRYSPGGQRVDAGLNGIQVVKMSDGTVRKVLVK